jgi:acyl carrier protein
METKILDVINEALKEKDIYFTQHELNAEFSNIDSITFIKIIVALEGVFDFEFDDEMLLISKFPTIESMIEYVKTKIS